MTSSRVANRRGFRFWIGIFLMAVSFGIYPAYPTIALLPISAGAKVAGSVFGSALSWALFFLGTFLAGNEGREFVSGFFTRFRRRKPVDESSAASG